jgi:hypothetical protein
MQIWAVLVVFPQMKQRQPNPHRPLNSTEPTLNQAGVCPPLTRGDQTEPRFSVGGGGAIYPQTPKNFACGEQNKKVASLSHAHVWRG